MQTPLYLISYDVKGDTEAIERLRNKLTQYEAVECLASQWLYQSGRNPKEIAADLAQVMNMDHDSLLVAGVYNAAFLNLQDERSKTLLNRAPRQPL